MPPINKYTINIGIWPALVFLVAFSGTLWGTATSYNKYMAKQDKIYSIVLMLANHDTINTDKLNKVTALAALLKHDNDSIKKSGQLYAARTLRYYTEHKTATGVQLRSSN